MPADDDEVARKHAAARPFVDGPRYQARLSTARAVPKEPGRRRPPPAAGDDADDQAGPRAVTSVAAREQGTRTPTSRAPRARSRRRDGRRRQGRRQSPPRARRTTPRARRTDAKDEADDSRWRRATTAQGGHAGRWATSPSRPPIYNDPDTGSDPSFHRGPQDRAVTSSRRRASGRSSRTTEGGRRLRAELQARRRGRRPAAGPRQPVVSASAPVIGYAQVSQSVATPGGTVPVARQLHRQQRACGRAVARRQTLPLPVRKAPLVRRRGSATTTSAQLFGGIKNMATTERLRVPTTSNLRGSAGYDPAEPLSA